MEIKHLEIILDDPENYIHEEINELKRQVDLEREKCKSQIDELADGLILQLESYERAFKYNVKSNVDLDYYTNLKNSANKKLVEFEKCLKLFSSKLEERLNHRKESEQLINILQPKLAEIKINLLSNLTINFKPAEKKIEDLFGKLEIKVCLIIKSNLYNKKN
jgi:hypothetical protein